MHFSYLLLLLLVVLSAYSESPHHVKPPDFLDPTSVAVCSNSSSAQLGILAPVLPLNEVYKTLPLNEVYKTLPHNEVYEINMLQNEVERIILPQNEAEWNKTVLSQSGMFKTDIVDCHLSDRVKIITNFVLNLE